MSIGKNIAKYRKVLGFTQEELGVKLGVTNQSVSKWESEVSMPDVMLLPKIAKVLGVNIYQLYGIDYSDENCNNNAPNRIRIGIIGYGHIGKAAVEAIKTTSDFDLVGVVSQSLEKDYFDDIPVVRTVDELKNVQIVLLCVPSRKVPEVAEDILQKGIYTVDCFDIHSEVYDLYSRLNSIAKRNTACAATAVGFDPGLDSVIRALLEAAAPKGLTYTNFGSGMSMGHTVAVKAIKGVKDGMSVTIPLGAGLHRRMVYVVIENNASFTEIADKIKTDPYFVNDETHVIRVSELESIIDMGHGTVIERKGGSGATNNQRFNFEMSIDNPALTAQMMVSAARALMNKAPGAYTMLHFAPKDLLNGSEEDLIKRLV